MDNIEQFYEAWAPIHSETYLNWRLIDVQYFKEGWDWGALAWKNIEKRVFNLQKRIYKATLDGQYSKANSLIKLLRRSSCNIVLSIRKVTQDNKGSKTPGIDNYRAISPKERVKLTKRLMDESRKRLNGYKAKPLKRIYIPKANGKQRPLGIPTQYDRVVQNMVKNAIEPKWEAEFAPESYGFRPAMGAQDAVRAIWHKIKNKPKWILDADIKGYFDNIDHEFILNLFEDPEKPIVREWLKAGYIDRKIGNEVIKTETGTPQGGIISPLIANKVLDGMQRWIRIALKQYLNANDPETETYKKIQRTKVVRYADDFIVINEDRNIIVIVKSLLNKWLRKRGVELSEEKTAIISSIQGFDFLGFHFQHHKGDKAKGNYRRKKIKEGTLNPENKYKLRITPSDKSLKKHKEILKETIGKAKAMNQEKLIGKLNPIILGWANYFRYVDSWDSFSKLQSYLWQLLFRWGRRRHPNKGKKWVKNRYFHTTSRSPKGWHYASKKEGNIDKALRYYGEAIQNLDKNHRYHTMVKEGKSFYDGDTIYWSKRLSKGYGGISPSKARMLKKQDGRCSLCKGLFKNEDLIEAHHIVFKSEGGEDKRSNLTLMHRHCHDQYHAKDTREKTISKGIKRRTSSKLEKEIRKTSKVLEVTENCFIRIENAIKEEIKSLNIHFNTIGKVRLKKLGNKCKLKITKGLIMEILENAAKHTGGTNPLYVCPDNKWIKRQIEKFYDMGLIEATNVEFRRCPEAKLVKWHKIESANMQLQGRNRSDRAAKASRCKTRRPQAAAICKRVKARIKRLASLR